MLSTHFQINHKSHTIKLCNKILEWWFNLSKATMHHPLHVHCTKQATVWYCFRFITEYWDPLDYKVPCQLLLDWFVYGNKSLAGNPWRTNRMTIMAMKGASKSHCRSSMINLLNLKLQKDREINLWWHTWVLKTTLNTCSDGWSNTQTATIIRC